VSVELHAGEVLVLLGPSGCGKTTLLRSVAGLEQPDAGRIEINGKVVYDSAAGVRVPTEKRGLSMIFQSYALWPHLTAFDNVAYPLRSRKVAKAAVEQRVLEVLEMVGIPELRNQHPSQMSGGQQQRVALARALVSNDDLILFDEPLSNVDARVREQLRFELAEMQQRLGFAAVYVTHDQIEALSLADRVAVMGGGSIQQLGTPREIYAEPSSRYVANFIGTTNELEGTVDAAKGEGHVLVRTELGDVEAIAGHGVGVGDAVVLSCRPEDCLLSSARPDAPNVWQATISTSMFMGSHTEYLTSVGGFECKVWSRSNTDLAHGAQFWLHLPVDEVRALRIDGAE
jgi:iron(III) transport system ATP-binding protein